VKYMEENLSAEFEVRSDINELATSLIEIKSFCDSYELFFWLNFGALLGMVREGRLLPWNNDVELGCWAHETSNEKIKAVTDALIGAGYTCFYYRSFGALNIKKGDKVDINLNLYWRVGEFAVRPHETPSKYQNRNILASVFYWLAVFIFVYPNTFTQVSSRKKFKDFVKVAVSRGFSFFSLKKRKKYFNKLLCWSEYWGGEFQQTLIPESYFRSFTASSFYGSELNFPAQPEELLTFVYGEDWRIPKDKWSWYDKSNKFKTGITVIKNKFNYNQIDLE
jgi:hypothetical protein